MPNIHVDQITRVIKVTPNRRDIKLKSVTREVVVHSVGRRGPPGADGNSADNLVQSVFTRIGHITSEDGDYTAAEVIFDDNYIGTLTGGAITGNRVQTIIDNFIVLIATTIGQLYGEIGDILSQLNDKQDLQQKGNPGGYAELDGTGKVPLDQLPDLASDFDGGDIHNDLNIIGALLNMGGGLINDVADPVDDQDAATKKYVDDNAGTTLGDLVYIGTWSASSGTVIPFDGGSHYPLDDNVGTAGDFLRVRSAGIYNFSTGGLTSFQINDVLYYDGVQWRKILNGKMAVKRVAVDTTFDVADDIIEVSPDTSFDLDITLPGVASVGIGAIYRLANVSNFDATLQTVFSQEMMLPDTSVVTSVVIHPGESISVASDGGIWLIIALVRETGGGASDWGDLGGTLSDQTDLQAALDAKQASDGDLATIAGLTPTNDDVLQRKSGAWINRTPAQLKADLALAKGDVGLGSVDNVQQQPIDSDLTAIAALAPADDSFIQRKSGVWVSRSVAQVKSDLAITTVATDTIFDAKGDLAVGTGADTASKLTVGADGTIAIASSNEANGLIYGRGFGMMLTSGEYTASQPSQTNAAINNQRLWYLPVFIHKRVTAIRIGVNHTATLAGAGSVVRLGIYTPHATNVSVPDALLIDAGTIASDSAAALKLITFSQILNPGLYFLAAVAQTASGSPQFNTGQPLIVLSDSTGVSTGAKFQNSVSGTLPANATPAAGNATQPPVIFLGI